MLTHFAALPNATKIRNTSSIQMIMESILDHLRTVSMASQPRVCRCPSCAMKVSCNSLQCSGLF